MLIERLPRFLGGWVEFEVKTSDIHSFLNSCLKKNITVFNVEFTDNGAKMSSSVCDYKRLQKIKVRRKILKRHGIRFFSNKYKKRIGFSIGFIFLVCALFILSGYVWNIDVTGNNRLSDNLILETLEQNGIYIGAKKSKIDIREIKRNIITELYDVSWITINIDGSFAHVEIKERNIQPISEDKSKPSNLVASDDGEIVKMEITKGKPIAMVGSGVKKGDLLVAGFYNDKKDNLILEHSSGKVTARLNMSKTFSCKKSIEKTIGYKKKTYYSINFMNNKLNLFWRKTPKDDEWTCVTNEKEVNLLGLKIPFSIREITYTKEICSNYELNVYEGKNRLLNEIDHFEKDELYDCVILRKNIVWKLDSDGCFTAIVDYLYEKNIAIQQYIDTDKHK